MNGGRNERRGSNEREGSAAPSPSDISSGERSGANAEAFTNPQVFAVVAAQDGQSLANLENLWGL
jgi:hypothetical protein